MLNKLKKQFGISDGDVNASVSEDVKSTTGSNARTISR